VDVQDVIGMDLKITSICFYEEYMEIMYHIVAWLYASTTSFYHNYDVYSDGGEVVKLNSGALGP